ncbi:MAG: retroviral-like aspartic protease family protein [Alphaproteobacteria bacterium]|nr:retroviral-like aspartic protease family protein [Alphaproteobacteria bacterium]
MGGLAAGACAGPRTALVNLAGAQPPDSAALATGLDLSSRMTAPVRINGEGPFPFVVDTGANRTVVSDELASSLGLRAGPVANVHGVAGVEPTQTAVVDELRVGSVVSRDLLAPRLPRQRLGADGLIGVDVLRNRKVLMDFRRGELVISADSLRDLGPLDLRVEGTGGPRRDLGPKVTVPARFRFGQLIIVGADVRRRPVTAFLDSGSQSTVGSSAMGALVSADLNAPRPMRLSVPVLSATGQTATGELGVTPLLKIGGLTITQLPTVFADLHVFGLWGLQDRAALLIGVDVMRQFNAIELDYRDRTVMFYLKVPA